MGSFRIKRNDTAPSIDATLEVDGTAVNLTGASVRFHMQNGAGDVIVDAAGNVDTPASGEVSYDWKAADTAKAGTYKAEWEVTFSDGSVRTFPNPGYTTVIIVGDLA